MNKKCPNVLLLGKFRQLHSYFAIFAAPSILFFCLTGLLQLFSFHEAHGTYQPPAFMEALGSLHKNQIVSVHHARPPSHDAAPGEGAKPKPDRAQAQANGGHGDSRPDKAAHWTLGQILLKLVFAVAAVAAMVSTGLGIWVGLSFGPKRRLLACLLGAGVVVPVLIPLLGLL